MSSAWAEEAERQARAITRDLIEVGRVKGFRVTYQEREARFALRAGTATAWFSAHDSDTPRGMDTHTRRGMQPDAPDAAAP